MLALRLSQNVIEDFFIISLLNFNATSQYKFRFLAFNGLLSYIYQKIG
ncbi:hypothetical protein GW750_05150 [bacterium]|nr:hypothetical protein [bacterium]